MNKAFQLKKYIENKIKHIFPLAVLKSYRLDGDFYHFHFVITIKSTEKYKYNDINIVIYKDEIFS